MVAWAANNLQRLLRRLRDVMGGASLIAQTKIDQIVHIVAADLAVDMCSIYALRSGPRLELIATQGLNPKCVRNIFIKIGQGVVSDVVENARPLVLSDITSHPKFYLDPELGEEQLTSFAGVPLFHGGKVLGALVVQNCQKRLFNHDEIETLQTIAMIVAELMVAGNLIKPVESLITDTNDSRMHKVKGVHIHAGCAIGHAVPHETLFPIKRLISDNIECEHHRLADALQNMYQSLQSMVVESTACQNTESREILETYQLFAQDRGWLNRIKKLIDTGFTVEAAIKKVKTDIRLQIMQSQDLFLRDRLGDFEDLTNRLLKQLYGHKSLFEPLSRYGIILIAKNMGAIELLDYEKYKLKGLILEESSQTAHIAIIARSLNIPVISQVSSTLHRINYGDLIVVDADRGEVIIRPSDDIVHQYELKMTQSYRQRVRNLAQQHLPNETIDGIKVSLHLNISSLTETQFIHTQNIDGIGLYRTEIAFMLQANYPNVRTQQQLYAQVLQEAGHYPVVFRTLDIGGDKNLTYMPVFNQHNPSLGWRALRIGLDLPSILRFQLRALLKAAAHQSLYILFPFVTIAEEFVRAKQLAEAERQTLAAQGEALPTRVLYGAMLETPSIICMLDTLLPQVDFVSVGSNDLAQYFFAADRTNSRIEKRYHTISPPFLSILQHVVDKAREYQKPLNICGEMAARPLEAAVLLALGFRQLSIAPSAVEAIKAMIYKFNLKSFNQYLHYLLQNDSTRLYEQLKFYGNHHGYF